MPSPSQSDLHVNVPLTNVSVAWMQSSDAYIADKVFPKCPVKKQSDLYWKYSKSDWRRTDVKRRAPSTESPGVGWNVTTDQYFAHVYAVHKDVDDQLRSNADSNFNLDRDATEFITNQMLLKRDLDWNARFFVEGAWDVHYTGATDFTKWSDGGSDPIGDVAGWILDYRRATGFKPNKMVLGAEVMNALKQHPDIIDRIKYTQKGIVSEDLIATLFGIDQLVLRDDFKLDFGQDVDMHFRAAIDLREALLPAATHHLRYRDAADVYLVQRLLDFLEPARADDRLYFLHCAPSFNPAP